MKHTHFTLFDEQPAPHIPGFRLILGETSNGLIGAAKVNEEEYQKGEINLLKLDALDVAALNSCGCYEEVDVYYGNVEPEAAEQALARLEAVASEEFCTFEEEERGYLFDLSRE